MREKNKKLTPAEVREMVKLRSERHLSYNLIGHIVRRDHSTVMYHCRKAGVYGHFNGVTRLTDVGLSYKIIKNNINREKKKDEIESEKRMKALTFKIPIKIPIKIVKPYINRWKSHWTVFPEEGKSMYEEYLNKYYQRQNYMFDSDRQKDLNQTILFYRLLK